MKRREFVKAGAALGALPGWKAQVPAPRPAGPPHPGPFTIGQDEGWCTIEAAAPAARRHGRRVGFRVQLSSPEIQPARLSLPDFLREKVPLVPIGATSRRGGTRFVEPRYDHPEFLRAFRELNELLAGRFDGDPLVE